MKDPQTNETSEPENASQTSNDRPITGWERFEDVPEITAADLQDFCDHDRRMLKIAAEMLANNSGCNTPFEEFLGTLLRGYGLRNITPDDVREDLEDFDRDFTSMAKESANFLAAYPQLFPAKCEPMQTEGSPENAEGTTETEAQS